MHSRLPEELRVQILDRLKSEPSDTKLASEFEVSRKTIWRLRQEPVKDKKPTPNSPKSKKMTTHQVSQSVATIPVKSPPQAVLEPVPEPVRAMDILPKVDVAPVVLGTYFAIQPLRGENYKQLSAMIMEAADKKGILFRKLQVLDTITVGAFSFIRFRSDTIDIWEIVKGWDRGVILPSLDGFQVILKGGKTGKFPAATMCTGPKIGFGQIYAGTRIKRWKQQFTG